MQCLPNIEILSFLNWMDVNGYAQNRIGVPLDELFLNEKYHDQVLALEREYMHGRSMDSRSEKAVYERYIDSILLEIKYYVMKEYDRPPYAFDDLFRRNNRDFRYFHHALMEMEKSSCSLERFDLTAICHYWEGAFTDSVRGNLKYFYDP